MRIVVVLPVGFRLVARNFEGMVIEARPVFYPHLVLSVLAEAMAFKEALSWMDSKGWHSATIESDCYVVVKAVRRIVPMRSYLGIIIKDCRRILHRLNKISLLFVKRSTNMVAQQLARESYYLSGSYSRWEFCSYLSSTLYYFEIVLVIKFQLFVKKRLMINVIIMSDL